MGSMSQMQKNRECFESVCLAPVLIKQCSGFNILFIVTQKTVNKTTRKLKKKLQSFPQNGCLNLQDKKLSVGIKIITEGRLTEIVTPARVKSDAVLMSTGTWEDREENLDGM